LKWINVDSLYQPLPASFHVYKTTDLLDGKPNIAYYVEADLKDKDLLYTIDTTWKRRITPSEFYERNNHPLLVVNTSFFSYETNRALNLQMMKGRRVEDNARKSKGRGADSVNFYMAYLSAMGLDKRRNADIAWVKTDTVSRKVYVSQKPLIYNQSHPPDNFKRWKMKTAFGGGPVLLQEGAIHISNNEELRFAGKAINDRHPRTAIGYTRDHKVILLMIQGRYPNLAEGATLLHEAQIFKDLGCWEAMNLDGGGSSCLLINGKETITPSEKGIQRPVPAVFVIRRKD
jgi:exopolysaccharide biosynthesis protein